MCRFLPVLCPHLSTSYGQTLARVMCRFKQELAAKAASSCIRAASLRILCKFPPIMQAYIIAYNTYPSLRSYFIIEGDPKACKASQAKRSESDSNSILDNTC